MGVTVLTLTGRYVGLNGCLPDGEDDREAKERTLRKGDLAEAEMVA